VVGLQTLLHDLGRVVRTLDQGLAIDVAHAVPGRRQRPHVVNGVADRASTPPGDPIDDQASGTAKAGTRSTRLPAWVNAASRLSLEPPSAGIRPGADPPSRPGRSTGPEPPNDDLVWDQFARIHVLGGLLAQFGPLAPFGPQQIAAGQMPQRKRLRQPHGLGALAGSRLAQE